MHTIFTIDFSDIFSDATLCTVATLPRAARSLRSDNSVGDERVAGLMDSGAAVTCARFVWTRLATRSSQAASREIEQPTSDCRCPQTLPPLAAPPFPIYFCFGISDRVASVRESTTASISRQQRWRRTRRA